jgi:hypothetical protein
MEVRGQRHATAALTPRKEPSAFSEQDTWGPKNIVILPFAV